MGTLSAALVEQYLSRIGLQQSAPLPPATLRTLARIQWAHLRTLPFENLSGQLDAARQQHKVDLRLSAIYRKMVLSRRGGYCFEQNGLLSAVLRSLGFDVVDAAARVVHSASSPPEEAEGALPPDGHALPGVSEPELDLRLGGHDHHILLVSLPGGAGEDGPPRLWLADCGFGADSPPLPLLLPRGAEQYAAPDPEACASQPYTGQEWAEGLPAGRVARYRLRLGLPGRAAVPDPAATPHWGLRGGYYLQRLTPDHGWRDLYFFRLTEFVNEDYSIQNHWIETNPNSFFYNNTFAALQTEEGRVTLLNDTFKAYKDGEAEPLEETKVEGEEALLEVLRTRFGIEF